MLGFQCFDPGGQLCRLHGAPLCFQYGRDSLPLVGRERAACDGLCDDRQRLGDVAWRINLRRLVRALHEAACAGAGEEVLGRNALPVI
jgi:hypothetical protein